MIKEHSYRAGFSQIISFYRNTLTILLVSAGQRSLKLFLKELSAPLPELTIREKCNLYLGKDMLCRGTGALMRLTAAQRCMIPVKPFRSCIPCTYSVSCSDVGRIKGICDSHACAFSMCRRPLGQMTASHSSFLGSSIGQFNQQQQSRSFKVMPPVCMGRRSAKIATRKVRHVLPALSTICEQCTLIDCNMSDVLI